MSGERTFDAADSSTGPDAGEARSARESPVTLDGLLGIDCEHLVRVAGGSAALAVAFAATVRILRNLPAEPVVVPAPLYSLATVGVPLVVGLGLVTVALASDRPSTRVGLSFAGVFAPMAAIDPAASLPAVAAVTVGGGIGIFGALDVPDVATDWNAILPLAAAIAFLLAIAVSLAASTAVIDGGFRPLGAAIALLATGALAARAESDRFSLFAGVVAGLASATAATANPFAAGGAFLAGFAIAGVPHLLVAVAVTGAVAATVAGLRRREPTLVAGAVLIGLAGMPTTAPRASAIVLGVALAVVGPARLVAAPDRNESRSAEVPA